MYQYDFCISYDNVTQMFLGDVIDKISLVGFHHNGMIELLPNHQLVFYHKDSFNINDYPYTPDAIPIVNFTT